VLKKAKLKGDFEVRGEVIMTRKAFEAMNRQQEQTGGKIFVNARNSAAGSVRVLDPSITAQREAGFFCVLFACRRQACFSQAFRNPWRH